MQRFLDHFNTREEMQKTQFEIFHYFDSQPGSVALHHHDFYEIYFFISGQVEYRIEGQSYQLQPGDLLLISPLELHQPIFDSVLQPYERIVLWISPAFLHQHTTDTTNLFRCFDISYQNHSNLLRLTDPQRLQLRNILDHLLEESRTPAFGQELFSLSLLLQFVIQLNRLMPRQLEELSSSPASTLTSKLIDYINQHYPSPLSLDSLAAKFYVSKYHLSHEFHRVMGISLHRYIVLKRLVMARQLLMMGETPMGIFEQCGFQDYSNFYRAFKAEYGVSPRQFTGAESDSDPKYETASRKPETGSDSRKADDQI